MKIEDDFEINIPEELELHQNMTVKEFIEKIEIHIKGQIMALAQYLYPLRGEITNDPLGRGYVDMTDQEVNKQWH